MTQLNEDLRAIKALIDTPSKWIRWINSLTDVATGQRRFCIRGAMHEVRDENKFWAQYVKIEKAISAALPEPWTGNRGLANYNDAVFTNHEDVMKVLDRAIEANP